MRCSVIATCVIGALASAAAAQPFYSNVTLSHFRGAEPTQTPGSASGGVSPLMADDMTSAGGYVSLIRLWAVNFNNNARSARVNLSFWYADGAPLLPGTLGSPGTYLTGSMGGGPVGPVSLQTAAVTLAAGDLTLVTLDLAAMNQQFAMPGGTMWVGVSFDNGGGATATTAELNNLGMALFDPVDVGSSSIDHMFKTTTAGSFVGVNNPVGVNPDFGAFGPPKNFAMEFVPAPGALALFGLGGAAAARRRRRPA